jgi:hypothetical protein
MVHRWGSLFVLVASASACSSVESSEQDLVGGRAANAGEFPSTLIVGVNAYYSFRPKDVDPDGISVTNWHTRLDREARFELGAWLEDLGVEIDQ